MKYKSNYPIDNLFELSIKGSSIRLTVKNQKIKTPYGVNG